jgi:hypothetical protein
VMWTPVWTFEVWAASQILAQTWVIQVSVVGLPCVDVRAYAQSFMEVWATTCLPASHDNSPELAFKSNNSKNDAVLVSCQEIFSKCCVCHCLSRTHAMLSPSITHVVDRGLTDVRSTDILLHFACPSLFTLGFVDH